MRLRSIAVGGLAAVILVIAALAASQSDPPAECFVSRVGPFRFGKQDVENLRAQLQPPPEPGAAERLLAESAACLLTQEPDRTAFDLKSALSCHRAFLSRVELENGGPVEAWAPIARAEMAKLVKAQHAAPEPCSLAPEFYRNPSRASPPPDARRRLTPAE